MATELFLFHDLLSLLQAVALIFSQGVYGIDLLAYRYTGDADMLVKRFVEEVDCPVCVAGSIGTFERLDRMKKYGPWAFTIGSAFFNQEFGVGLSFSEQIRKVVRYIEDRP